MGPKNPKSKYGEATKIGADYLKHVSTLSTGSVVLIATLLEKVAPHPLWKATIIIALAGFLGSGLCSVVAFTSLVIGTVFWEEGEEPVDWVDSLGGMAFLTALFFFSIGIISFTVFAIRNLPGI